MGLRHSCQLSGLAAGSFILRTLSLALAMAAGTTGLSFMLCECPGTTRGIWQRCCELLKK